jgi:MYXO-CTERM domain-containing protein
LYGSVDDIDAWVGLLAEDPMSGSSIGETVAAILAKQFGLLRDGDRFFYLNDSDFTALELAALQDTSLSDIIIDNTEIGWMQNNVFFYVTRTPEPGTALLAILGVMMIAARRPRREMLGG